MIGKIMGALIGAEVGKRQQQGGLKGALVGVVAAGLIRRLGPVGLALGGAYAAKKMYDRRRADTINQDV